MEKLFSLKDEESELYAQIKISKEIWKFLNDLTHKLFNKSWMIDDHYQSLWNKTNINDYFHFKENGVDLIIIITNLRAHIVILGSKKNEEIKKFLFENYSF